MEYDLVCKIKNLMDDLLINDNNNFQMEKLFNERNSLYRWWLK